jgi:glycosyltransferase involved in cell wall biosynthesis
MDGTTNSAKGPFDYSICITHYNNVGTVRAALDTLLGQIDSRSEVIVVDNFSTDGSAKILEEYRDMRKIRLVQKKCSRGVGRDTALRIAGGKYIIGGLDMDDTFKPRLSALLDFYHAKCEGYLLITEIATHIMPRDLAIDLGGYHDLQFNEIWDLCRRSATADRFRWTIFPLLETINEHHERKTVLGRVRYEYVQIRDRYRVGKRPFGGTRKRIRLYQRLIQILVVYAMPFYRSFKSDAMRKFTIVDKKFFVDSSGWWQDMKDSNSLKRKYISLLGTKLA